MSDEQTPMEQQAGAFDEQAFEQLHRELDAWLAERGVTAVIMARGRRSGQLSPLVDFLPDTHDATIVLVPRQ